MTIETIEKINGKRNGRVISLFPEKKRRIRRSPSSSEFKKLVDRALHFLGLTERALVHRVIAEKTGFSTRTITRYEDGELLSIPETVLEAAEDLVRQAKDRELIVFHRGRNFRPVVQRYHMVALVDYAVASGVFRDRFELFSAVEEETGFSKGRMARLYRSDEVQLVDEEVYEAVRKLSFCQEYDPCREYDVGERLRHSVFGTGTVEGKLQLNRIAVRFAEFGLKILRENLYEVHGEPRVASSLYPW